MSIAPRPDTITLLEDAGVFGQEPMGVSVTLRPNICGMALAW